MQYTYIWSNKPKLICCLDQGVIWKQRGLNHWAVCSTNNHPSTWNKEYKLVSFIEFSYLIGVTIDDVLEVQ